MEWNRMIWYGMEWNEWNGMNECISNGWNGMNEWYGIEWNGIKNWNGIWNVEWNGIESNRME